MAKMHLDETTWSNIGDHIGCAVAVSRVVRRMTQEEMAAELSELLGEPVRQNYVSNIERGVSMPSWLRFGLICQVLSIRPSTLISLAESIMEDGVRDQGEILKEVFAMLGGASAGARRSRSSEIESILQRHEA